VGILLRFVRFAHYTTQATHQPPPHMRFRYAKSNNPADKRGNQIKFVDLQQNN